MKRRWLITFWITALLSLGAWAGLPSLENCALEQDCCCSQTAPTCCGCGCELSPAPLPVAPPTSGPARLPAPGFSVALVGPTPSLRLVPRAVVPLVWPAPRSPRELEVLAGSATWRGPPVRS